MCEKYSYSAGNCQHPLLHGRVSFPICPFPSFVGIKKKDAETTGRS